MLPVKRPYIRTGYFGQQYAKRVLRKFPALKHAPFYGKCLGYEYKALGNKGIYAPTSGKVVFVGEDRYGAVLVKIQRLKHPCYKWIIQLAHMKKGSIRVRRGQKVKMGQRIGTQGKTGRATGTHVQVKAWGGKHMRIRNPKQVLLLKLSKKKPKPKKLTRKGLIKVIDKLLLKNSPQAILNALKRAFKV